MEWSKTKPSGEYVWRLVDNATGREIGHGWIGEDESIIYCKSVQHMEYHALAPVPVRKTAMEELAEALRSWRREELGVTPLAAKLRLACDRVLAEHKECGKVDAARLNNAMAQNGAIGDLEWAKQVAAAYNAQGAT